MDLSGFNKVDLGQFSKKPGRRNLVENVSRIRKNGQLSFPAHIVRDLNLGEKRFAELYVRDGSFVIKFSETESNGAMKTWAQTKRVLVEGEEVVNVVGVTLNLREFLSEKGLSESSKLEFVVDGDSLVYSF